MTKVELKHVQKVLERVKDRDAQVEKALAYVAKDLAQYAARKGQLKDQYEYDSTYW